MSSAHRGECVTTGGLYRPTHLCSTLRIAQKLNPFFFHWCVKVGGCLGGVHVSGGSGLHGVSEGGRGDLSSGLSQPGGKSC